MIINALTHQLTLTAQLPPKEAAPEFCLQSNIYLLVTVVGLATVGSRMYLSTPGKEQHKVPNNQFVRQGITG